MRTYDQRLIDQALANPDLQSEDPEKKAAAEAERRDLEDRMRAYDATDQRTQALADGNAAPADVIGRDTQTQLDAYYARAKDHDTEASGLAVAHVATKHERMERIREKAHVDSYAAGEMLSEGDARASTKVRRAELAGNIEQKAEILESLDKKDTAGSTRTLAAQAAEYSEKFGRDMLAKPDVSSAERMVTLAGGLIDDDRSAHEIAEQLAREDMSDGELRMAHVRETGVLADRTRRQRAAQMRERADNSHSGWLAGSEMLSHMRGGNRGSEDRLESAVTLMERGNVEGVDDREQARRDKSATSALALQREEKQREAAKIAQVISIAAKIAAILTANPALFVAVDAGFTALRIAAQEMIANEAFEIAPELEHMAVDVVVNMATARFAGMGKGVQAGTQAAKGVQIVQRIGMGAAAVGGAAAHSALDGEGGGAAIFQTVLGVTGLGNYARGKLEGLFKGSGRLSRLGRAVGGTFGEAGVNIGVSGGHVDMNTLLDAGGNTVQDRMHGHAPRKATHDDYERVTRSSHIDYDAPRRSDEDSLRRTPMKSADLRLHDVDAHAREVEQRRAQAAMEAHGHFTETDGPSYAHGATLHAGSDDARDTSERPSREVAHPSDASSANVGSDKTNHHPARAKTPREWAMQRQAEANALRDAKTDPEWEAIKKLKETAETPEHFDYIRGLEEEYKVRVSQRTGAAEGHPNPKAIEEHEATLLALQRETEVAIREQLDAPARARVDDQLAKHDGVGVPEVRLATKVSVGMGGAGSSAAVADPTDRVGVENKNKRELWRGQGHKPAGQSPYDISGYGVDGVRPFDVAMHPHAEFTRSSELALHVAAQRLSSGVGTIETDGPVRSLEFRPVLDEAGNIVRYDMGLPMNLDGKEVLGRTDRVDITTGLGPARELQTTDTPSRRAQLTPEQLAKMKEKGSYIGGEEALTKDPTTFAGQEVLGIGGGPISVWAMEHAKQGKAKSVEVAGQMPTITDPALAERLRAVRETIAANLDASPDVMAPLTEEYRRVYDEHIKLQLKEREHLKVIAGDQTSSAREREKAQQQIEAINNDLDPFLGARVDRNDGLLNDPGINYVHADVLKVEPKLDPATNTERVEVTYADGTKRFVDKVVPSIGADPNEAGGIGDLLRKMPDELELLPVIVDGRVVGLESDPRGITISGAVLTGTLGHNMPRNLLNKIPPEYRDAVLGDFVDHSLRRGVSADTRGIVPGIENVGDAPALMQQALQRDELAKQDPDFDGLSQEAQREEFLQEYRRKRESFGGERRFSDKTLMLDQRPAAGRT